MILFKLLLFTVDFETLHTRNTYSNKFCCKAHFRLLRRNRVTQLKLNSTAKIMIITGISLYLHRLL